MSKVPRNVIVGAFALVFASAVLHTWAQKPPEAGVGTAVYLSPENQRAALKKSAKEQMWDEQLTVVDVNKAEYHVGVGIVHRSKASVATQPSYEHSDITEVYDIISGTGTLETGGTIKDMTKFTLGSPSGPTASGKEIMNGVSRKVGPGDIIIIPPYTAHVFTAITSDEIVYTVVRPDPHKVLPVMNLFAK